jgi:hypothetical protein
LEKARTTVQFTFITGIVALSSAIHDIVAKTTTTPWTLKYTHIRIVETASTGFYMIKKGSGNAAGKSTMFSLLIAKYVDVV